MTMVVQIPPLGRVRTGAATWPNLRSAFGNRLSSVTSCTSEATGAPKVSINSSTDVPVSSIVSCNSAAQSVSWSLIPTSTARIDTSPATLELLVSLRSSEASSRFLSVPLLHSRSVDRQSAIASS